MSFKYLIIFLLVTSILHSQVKNDSVLNKHSEILSKHERQFEMFNDSLRRIRLKVEDFQDLALSGTRIISRQERAQESPQVTIGGYVSTYYAWYSDTADGSNFQKFPTAAPQSEVFSLNLAQISARYVSRSSRANIVLHYGDMPRSVWSNIFPFIQEANAGIRFFKKFWLDAGLFRTHIGLESIQPRENIASGVAVATYFEPYYLAGAKLSYVISPKLTLQLNCFNSFNGFVETNHKKAVGASLLYEPNSKFSITLNSLYNDDSPDTARLSKGRIYNNLYLVYKQKRITLGFEANYGYQENTSLSAEHDHAQMVSLIALLKLKLLKQFSIYGRGEYFNDPDEMLTGPEYNQNHKLIGLVITGGTFGCEFKPLENTYLRLEGRLLETHDDNEEIFLLNNKSSRIREEVLCTFGVWF